MIESAAVELIEASPSIKKILRKLSKALKSGEKDDFFEQIDSLAQYIDQQPVEFWDTNDIADYLHRDSKSDSLIRGYMDKVDCGSSFSNYRLREIEYKIDNLNFYHEIDFHYRTGLAQAEDRGKKLLKEKKGLLAVGVDKRIEANSRVTARYKEQIGLNQKAKEQAETTLYLLRAMKRYMELKIKTSKIEINKMI